jgi:membrane protein required for colicin V production
VSLDLVVLVAVLVFAFLGALSGFARQVAQAAGLVLAFFGAAPLGNALGAWTAARLGTSLTLGVVLSTVVAFLLVYGVVRFLLTALVRRLLAGKDPDNRGADRGLGALLGGLKAAAFAFIGLCAATFVEHNVSIAGRRFTLTPRDSVLVPLARDYNLIEHLQFSGARTLARALQVATSPTAATALKDDPDFQALVRDPRFKGLLSHPGLKGLLAAGDLAGLMKSGRAADLLEDPRVRERLERLGRLAE